MSDLTPRDTTGHEIYTTASVVVLGPDGKPRPVPPPPRIEYRDRIIYRDRPIWWWPLLIPVGLMLFLAGLFIGAKIEEGSVVAPVQGISPEGHEGQTLVVEADGTTRWCEQTDPACHEVGE